jgi:hypothetical protein
MTPDQRRLIHGLVFVPGKGARLSKEEFLRQFDVTDGQELGLRLLRDAAERQDGEDVEMVLTVSSSFGFTTEHINMLVSLVSADWHMMHEDVVAALARLRCPDTVDALYHATQWVPEYLHYDEDRALAMKAIRALAKIPDDRAEQALIRVLDSDDELVREKARHQLEKRRSQA